MSQQRIFSGEILQREVCGVAVIGMQHDETCISARLASLQQLPRRQPRPLIVVARPGGDAMNVRDDFRLRLRVKLTEIPEYGIVDRTVDIEPPTLARNLWRQSEI